MRPEDIRAFAKRDWRAIAAVKDEAWLEVRRRLDFKGALAHADALRCQVRRVRPDWPTRAERDDDLAVHARVAEVLRRAGRACGD
jgi:hypothetical protein